MTNQLALYKCPKIAKYGQTLVSVLGETPDAYCVRFSGSWLKEKCLGWEEEQRYLYRGFISKADSSLLVFDATYRPPENADFHGSDARVYGVYKDHYYLTVWNPLLAPMLKDPVVTPREHCEGWVQKDDPNLVFRRDGLMQICGRQFGAILNGHEVTLFNEDDGFYYLRSTGESFRDIATHSYDMKNNSYRCRIPKERVQSLKRISCWDGKEWVPIEEYERRHPSPEEGTETKDSTSDKE